MSSILEGISKRINEGVSAMHSNLKKTNSCTSCSASFSFTRSKKMCNSCKEHYCSLCIVRKSDNPNDKRCKRCIVFSRHELVWEELMELRVKDLIWFLNRQGISSQGLKEKEQLAELILDYYGNEEYHRRRVTREKKIAERLMENEPTPDNEPQSSERNDLQMEASVDSNPGSSHNPEEEPMEVDQPCDYSINVVSDPEVPIAAPDIPPPPYGPEEASNSVGPSQEEVTEPPSPTQISPPDRESTPQAESSGADVSASTLLKGGTERVTLNELESEAQVEMLTVKQMKDLLASNFVDYKGCVERHELLIRAKRLWKSYFDSKQSTEESNNANSSNSKTVLSENECRICMDDVINCVLLECGHMCTCVSCGKQLAECPICRQYVVRVVRTFRS